MSADLDARAFTKRKGSLWPSDPIAEEMIEKLKDGKEVLVTIRRARNPQHHRLLWAMLRKVVDNSDQWASEAVLLDELKLATGLAEVRVNLLTGKPYAVPGSISFAAMDQTKFSAWFDQAVHLLATRVLKCAPQELIDEITAMAGPRDMGRAA
jgi:hypothetical protein